MENHLIIGLGGTGGSILRAFKQRVHQNEDEAKNANFAYLWVDSDIEEMRESWKVMGQSIELDEGEKVVIAGAPKNIVTTVDQYESISPWIDKKAWTKYVEETNDKAAGQRRRVGRLLFAYNGVNKSSTSFMDALQTQVIRLRGSKSKKHDVTFHICTGLSGGTGSGSIIDVVSQIREAYKPSGEEVRNKIIIYAKLPEGDSVPRGWNTTGYYNANGYAALLELNALSAKTYKPVDITGNEKDEKGNVKRLLQDLGTIEPFDQCFIFEHLTSTGISRSIEKGEDGELPELQTAVADFIFYTIVKDGLGKFATIENAAAQSRDGKSYRFATFGITRIAYPETEIKEYVTYNYARQALLQFKSNKWVSGDGFIEEINLDALSKGYATEIDKNIGGEKWCISDSHLILSNTIDENEKWDDTIDAYWSNIKNIKMETLQKEAVQKDLLKRLNELCDHNYNEIYRGAGVAKFYDLKEKEIPAYAATIRSNIERELFKEWARGGEGTKPISGIEIYVDMLIKHNLERIKTLDKKPGELEKKLREVTGKINDKMTQWGTPTLWQKIIGKRNSWFEGYLELLKDKYILKTKIQGYKYAVPLLSHVNRELYDLHDRVAKFNQLMEKALKKINRNIDSRINDDPQRNTLSSGNYKIYKQKEVTDITKLLTKSDRAKCEGVTLNVRTEVIKKARAEETHSFDQLRKFSIQDFVDCFERECEKVATTELKKHKNTLEANHY